MTTGVMMPNMFLVGLPIVFNPANLIDEKTNENSNYDRLTRGNSFKSIDHNTYIMIIGYPKLAKIVDKDSYVYNSVQTCLSTNSNSSLTTTAASSVSALSVLDFKIPLFGQALLLTIIAILFIIFFKCAYLRLRSEREKLAEQILNSARVLN
jgi:hypothetical protein